jgi:hypothetical protein
VSRKGRALCLIARRRRPAYAETRHEEGPPLMKTLTLTVLLAGLAVPFAAAQDDGANDPKIQAEADKLAGVYAFDLQEGGEDSYCLLKLEARGGYDMFDVWLAPTCETKYPFFSYLRSWVPIEGGIKLYGTEGVTLGEFKRVVDVGYVATLEADGKAYVLSQMLQ